MKTYEVEVTYQDTTEPEGNLYTKTYIIETAYDARTAELIALDKCRSESFGAHEPIETEAVGGCCSCNSQDVDEGETCGECMMEAAEMRRDEIRDGGI